MPQCIRKKANGERCRKDAMLGQTECNKHGGTAPQKVAAAKRRRQEDEAAKVLADRKVWDENAAPTTNPVEELMALSGRLREAVATLGARLEQSDPCVCCGCGEEMDAVRVLAFNKTIAASQKILTDLARLGLEDRRVRVHERQADIALAAAQAAIWALIPTMDEAQEILARDVFIKTVRELEAVPQQ